LHRSLILAATVSLFVFGGHSLAQQPALPDTSTIGPQIGSAVPAFSGVDQLGRTQTLQSVMGPKGAMLVFFRSADW